MALMARSIGHPAPRRGRVPPPEPVGGRPRVLQLPRPARLAGAVLRRLGWVRFEPTPAGRATSRAGVHHRKVPRRDPSRGNSTRRRRRRLNRIDRTVGPGRGRRRARTTRRGRPGPGVPGHRRRAAGRCSCSDAAHPPHVASGAVVGRGGRRGGRRRGAGPRCATPRWTWASPWTTGRPCVRRPRDCCRPSARPGDEDDALGRATHRGADAVPRRRRRCTGWCVLLERAATRGGLPREATAEAVRADVAGPSRPLRAGAGKRRRTPGDLAARVAVGPDSRAQQAGAARGARGGRRPGADGRSLPARSGPQRGGPAGSASVGCSVAAVLVAAAAPALLEALHHRVVRRRRAAAAGAALAGPATVDHAERRMEPGSAAAAVSATTRCCPRQEIRVK